jgi:hypothetical protein
VSDLDVLLEQLKRISIPSVPEEARIQVQRALDQYVSTVESTIGPTLKELTAVLGSITSIAPRFEGLAREAEIGAAAFLNSWPELDAAIVRLAKGGWVIPAHVETLDEVVEIAQSCASGLELDARLADYHDSNTLAPLFSDLEGAPLQDWQPLVSQAIASFKNGDHALSIPALISIFEGAIARITGTTSHRLVNQRNLPGPVRSHLQSFHTDVFSYALFKSLDSFIHEYLFAHSDFSLPPPSLNRHFVMHGRDRPDRWTRTDALRVLNALWAASLFVPYETNSTSEEIGK